MYHRSRGLEESRFADMVACFFALDRCCNVRTEFRIVGATPEPPVEVMFHLAEKAGADLSVGG
jgi:hypothetical protein